MNPISLDCVLEELSRTLLFIFSDTQRLCDNYFGDLIIVSIV
jgi:hypothetical protein